MKINTLAVSSVALPADSDVRHVYPMTNLADAYSVALPPGADTRPETLARFIFTQQSPIVAALMAIRDLVVTPFGLKTAYQLQRQGTVVGAGAVERIGIFRIYGITDREIIMGEDDRHLNFRISVLHQAAADATGSSRVVVSTVVQCHNRLGRAYIFIIAPFHRAIVRGTLSRAARADWPKANQA